MRLADAIKLYIELRDKKDALKREYEEKVASIKSKMDVIEAKVLGVLDSAGTNSMNTDGGTAYKAVRVSATVADKDTFLDFVRKNDEWSLMDVRASKQGIEQYKAANEELPPGINYSETRVVNFRR